MALSGSKTVPVTNWDSLLFEWKVASQSVATNSSYVEWKLKLVSTSNGRIDSSAQKTWTVTVNGVTKSGSNQVGIANNATKVLATGSVSIGHNADGTKSFNYSFSQTFGITFSGQSIGTISGSGSGTLNTIARASQPSCVTWPEHTQNVGEFGQEISIHMNRQSSAFTHTVRYAFGNQTGTIATGVGTGTTWVIPLTLMNLIPSASGGSGTIYVDTYNGSTKIGTKSCGFTATVPNTVKPSATLTITDPTGYSAQYGGFVQGISKFKVFVGPSLAYQSPIHTCSITANGSTVSGEFEITTDILKSSGTLSVSASVIDGRGRTGSVTQSVTVIPYVKPNISKLTVHRCNSNGTENTQGEYVKVIFSASVTSLSSKNTATYSLKFKKSTATTYTDVSLTALANSYTVTDHSYIFAADSGSSYDVTVTTEDNHNATTAFTNASTAFALVHIGADGESLSLGKTSEKPGWLENNLPTENLKTHVQLGNKYTMSSPGVAGSAGYVKVAEITVTAANADTPITFVLSRRQEQSTMTVHVQLKNASGVVATLTSIRYEGSNYGAFAQSTDGTTWGLYVQKGSGYDTITVQDWWMSKTMESRVKVTFPGTLVATLPTNYYRATPLKADSLVDFIYPVGSVVVRYDHYNPNELWGGTWVRITNRFLWACDASGEIGVTGGEKTHALTVAEMPSHTHNVPVASTATGSLSASNYIRFNNNATTFIGNIASAGTGSGTAHNNMPPYIQVSIWRRTA